MTIETALVLAANAHRNQKDKSGETYMKHILRVYAGCETDEQRIVAILHDIIEDTSVGYKDLDGFSQDVIKAVKSITKVKGEEYTGYLKRVSENELARYVKIKDLQDNMNIARLKSIEGADLGRLNKYIKALQFLTNILNYI